MPEPDAPGSPLAWLKVLDRRRLKDKPKLDRWDRYHSGDHPMEFATEKFRQAFGNMLRAFSDNWCPIIVDSVIERMTVQGFRFGDDTNGDDLAWYVWQANNLDADSVVAHREALVLSRCALLIDPTTRIGARQVAQITVEHPGEMVIAADPANRRRRLAALKRWCDDFGTEMATVYLPDTVWRYQRVRGKWVPRIGVDESVPNPLGVVPVVELANRDRLLKEPVAEFDRQIGLQDAINKLFLDLIVASEFTAYYQRWATGIELPNDPTDPTGKRKLSPFNVGMDRLFTSENPEAKFGAFPQSDLTPYVRAITVGVNHLAAQSRTPPHYLLGEIVNASGDALKAAETGLVSKVRSRMRTFEDPWEEAIGLAVATSGGADRARTVEAHTLWADPESRTESEHVDATIKMLAAGVPQQAIWERLGFSPQEIARFRQMLQQEVFEQAAIAGNFTGLPVPPLPPVAEGADTGAAA